MQLMNIQDLIKHTEKKKPNNNLVSKHHCFRPGEEKKKSFTGHVHRLLNVQLSKQRAHIRQISTLSCVTLYPNINFLNLETKRMPEFESMFKVLVMKTKISLSEVHISSFWRRQRNNWACTLTLDQPEETKLFLPSKSVSGN